MMLSYVSSGMSINVEHQTDVDVPELAKYVDWY